MADFQGTLTEMFARKIQEFQHLNNANNLFPLALLKQTMTTYYFHYYLNSSTDYCVHDLQLIRAEFS